MYICIEIIHIYNRNHKNHESTQKQLYSHTNMYIYIYAFIKKTCTYMCIYIENSNIRILKHVYIYI